jgi:hypothetical protein
VCHSFLAGLIFRLIFRCKASGLCIAGPCVDESLRRIAVLQVDGEVRLAEAVDTDRLQRGPW